MYTPDVTRTLRLLGLVLLAFAAAGPGVEAIVPCLDECPTDDAAGGCSLEMCCSCCVHFRVDPPGKSGLAPELRALARVMAGAAPLGPTADPREILHVPKLLLSPAVSIG
jgi:hypothetical protein